MEHNNEQKLTKYQKKMYFRWGATIFLTIAAAILFFFTMYKMTLIKSFFSTVFNVLQPIIFGIIIAYILIPTMNGIEKRLLSFSQHRAKHKKKPSKHNINYEKLTRNISVFLSVALLIIVIYILGNMILPELANTITKLARDLPGQFSDFIGLMNGFLENNSYLQNIFQEAFLHSEKYIETWINENLLSQVNTWINYFAVSVKNFVDIVANFIIGLIVAVYVLNSKETFTGQAKKIIYAVTDKQKANIIIDTVRQSNKIFSGFISGKILDSFIVGVILFVVMSILKMPYTMLISLIVGVTNVIPFFGPFIGAIPSILLMLLASPIEAIYLAIIIIILQQLDGNVIGPKILGQSTGLAPFWVIFSILIGGGLFGFLGMLFGVPAFGVLYHIIKKVIEYLLKKRNLPIDSMEYTDIERITSEGIEKTKK